MSNTTNNWVMIGKRPDGVHFTIECDSVENAMKLVREVKGGWELVKMYPISEKAADYVKLVHGN